MHGILDHLGEGARVLDLGALHGLDHVVELQPALQELGRVTKRDGGVFVAVPNARTLTDRVYRRVYADRGGHVNGFDSEPVLMEMLSWYRGLPHIATRLLPEPMRFHTRAGLYGWGRYFGQAGEMVDPQPRPNVCLRCVGDFVA